MPRSGIFQTDAISRILPSSLLLLFAQPQVSFLEIYQERIKDLLSPLHPGLQQVDNANHDDSPQCTTPDGESDIDQHPVAVSKIPKPIIGAKCPASPMKSPHRTPPSPRTPVSPRSPKPSPRASPRKSPSTPQQRLKIREHPKLGPYVVGLTRRFVTSWQDMKDLLAEGQGNRTIGATDMNQQSSRSHTVFSMTITQVYSLLFESY